MASGSLASPSGSLSGGAPPAPGAAAGARAGGGGAEGAGRGAGGGRGGAGCARAPAGASSSFEFADFLDERAAWDARQRRALREDGAAVLGAAALPFPAAPSSSPSTPPVPHAHPQQQQQQQQQLFALGTRGGEISVFAPPPLGATAGCGESFCFPFGAVPVPGAVSAVYAVAGGVSGREAYLAAAGDTSVRVWRWKDLLSALRAARAKDTGDEHDELRARGVYCSPFRELAGGVPHATDFPTPSHADVPAWGSPLLRFWETNDLAVVRAAPETLWAASADGCVYGYDVVAEKRAVSSVPPAEMAPAESRSAVLSLAVRACGQIVSGAADGEVRLWDPRERAAVVRLPNAAVGGSATCVAVDAGDKWLAIGGTRTVQLWYLPLLAKAATIVPGCAPQALAFSDSRLLIGGNVQHVSSWTLSGERVARLPCSSQSVFALESGDGLVLAAGIGRYFDMWLGPDASHLAVSL